MRHSTGYSKSVSGRKMGAKYVAWHGGDFTKESVKAPTKTMKNKPSVKMWDYVQYT